MDEAKYHGRCKWDLPRPYSGPADLLTCPQDIWSCTKPQERCNNMDGLSIQASQELFWRDQMYRPMGRYRRRNIWKLHFLQCSSFSYTAILGHSPCDGHNPVRVRQCHERIRLLLRYHAKPFQATRWTVVDRSERDGTVHGAQLPEDYGRAVADQLRPPLPTLGNSSSHT